MAARGLKAYEVSNYARPGRECRQRLQQQRDILMRLPARREAVGRSRVEMPQEKE